jgi:hypothetical protein
MLALDQEQDDTIFIALVSGCLILSLQQRTTASTSTSLGLILVSLLSGNSDQHAKSVVDRVIIRKHPRHVWLELNNRRLGDLALWSPRYNSHLAEVVLGT